MLRQSLLLLISCTLVSTSKAVSLTATTNYPSFCLEAAHNDQLFTTFRSHPLCKQVVENVPYDIGEKCLELIYTNYADLVPHLPKIVADDVVGSPLAFNYAVGSCSPVTLRYAKIAGDLNKKFETLSGLNIVEIGGGFGGQCKVLHDTFGFGHYTIVDLPQCTPLIKKYVAHFGINKVTTLNSTDIKEPLYYDLVISNYAISEIDRNEQLTYLNAIINRARHGYIIYNVQPTTHPFTLQEFMSHLAQSHPNLYVELENPISAEGNVVIVW